MQLFLDYSNETRGSWLQVIIDKSKQPKIICLNYCEVTLKACSDERTATRTTTSSFFLSLRKDYIEVIRWSENDNNDDDDRFLFGCSVLILTTVKMKKWPLGRRTSILIQMFTQETVNVKP